MKSEKTTWVFLYIKYSKFWSISLENFVEHKPLIYEEWLIIFFHRSTKLIGYIMVVQLWSTHFTALWKIRFNFPREFYKAYFSPTIDRDIWIMAPLDGSLDMKLHTDSTIRADNLICKVIFGIKSLTWYAVLCENFSHFSIKLLVAGSS